MDADADWTLAVGLRGAVVHLTVWCLICGFAWFAIVYAAAPLIQKVGPGRVMIPGILIGAAVGWLVGRNLGEAAGFGGWIPLTLAMVFLAVTLIGGVAFVDSLRVLPLGSGLYLGGGSLIAACGVLIYIMLTDM